MTLTPTGIVSAYNAGELTLTIPRTALGGADPLGVHVISGRRQPMGAAVFISSDFAPNQGCCINWAGTATASSADPTADHEAAPDITSVSVSDTAKGWIRFAITTPNYVKLRGEDTLVFLHIDTDFRRSTGQVGADFALGHVDGGAYLDRWSNAESRWINVPGSRVLVRTQNANNVVTLDVHRSELGDVRRFQFRATSAVLHFGTGLTFGVDQAPDIRTTYWGYKFANKTVVRLVAGKTRRASGGAAGGCSLHGRRSDEAFRHEPRDHVGDGHLQGEGGREARAGDREHSRGPCRVRVRRPAEGKDRERVADRSLGEGLGHVPLLVPRPPLADARAGGDPN